jgi:hypothetical protein
VKGENGGECETKRAKRSDIRAGYPLSTILQNKVNR